MSPEIEIIIDDEGNLQVEAHGFKGRGCLEAIRKLLAGLGDEVEARRTREFYEAEEKVGRIKQ